MSLLWHDAIDRPRTFCTMQNARQEHCKLHSENGQQVTSLHDIAQEYTAVWRLVFCHTDVCVEREPFVTGSHTVLLQNPSSLVPTLYCCRTLRHWFPHCTAAEPFVTVSHTVLLQNPSSLVPTLYCCRTLRHWFPHYCCRTFRHWFPRCAAAELWCYTKFVNVTTAEI
jgi:hypothetical protein